MQKNQSPSNFLSNVVWFVILLVLTSCAGNTTDQSQQPFAEGSQVFVITPDGIDHLATNAPALIVTLRILTTTNSNGQIEQFWSGYLILDGS